MTEIQLGALLTAPVFIQDSDSSLLLSPSSSRTSPSTRKLRGRKCFVYNHMPNDNPNTQYFNVVIKAPKWRYRYYNQRYALNRGTKIQKDYLRKEHDITDSTRYKNYTKKRQLLIEESIATRQQHPRLRCRLITRIYSTIKGDPLKILLVCLLASSNLPLLIVENKEFRDLLFYYNRDANDLIPRSYNLVKQLVLSIEES